MIKYYNLVKPWSRWLFLMLFLFSLQSKALTQDSIQVSINAVNKPIEVVFKQIENQTGYTVFYGRPTLNGDEIVTLQTRASLSSVMNAVLRGRGVVWALKDRSIILTKKVVAGENGSTNLDTLPKVNITGSVVDRSGKPVVGATVSLRGQAMGQATDNLGRFKFENIPGNATLIVSSVGYGTKSIKLSGLKDLMISLDTLVHNIKSVEVYSTGYETVNKERATGSFVKIDNELFNRKISPNVLDRISEITSGANFTPKGGAGNKPPLSIRGISSINSNTTPLIVIDGFPYENGTDNFQELNNHLSNINPNDVESITVLKDAAAASIWGARAGNGVIVITTKKGKFNQRMAVRLVSNITIGERPNLSNLPLMSSQDEIGFEESLFLRNYYLSVENEGNNSNSFSRLLAPVYELLIAKRNGTIAAKDADEKISAFRSHDIRSDIKRHFLRKSISQQYSLSISGGSSSYNYFTSIGYDKNRSNTVGNENARITLRFDNTFRPIEKIELNGYMVFTQSTQELNGIEYTGFMGRSPAIYTPYTYLSDNEGNSMDVVRGLRSAFVDTIKSQGYLDWHYRPLDEIRNSDYSIRNYNTRLGGGARYDIIKGLSAELKGQYEKAFGDERILRSIKSFETRDLINSYMFKNSTGQMQYPIPIGGIIDNSKSELTTWNLRSQINFNHHKGNDQLAILAGAEMREISVDNSGSRKYGVDAGTNLFTARIDYNALYLINPSRSSSTTIPNRDYYNGVLNRFISYYANGAYTYGERYTVSFSGRKDGANIFGVKSNDRITPLWSTGLAWNVAEENFYKISWLTYLKVRASFGYNGNMKNDATTFATIKFSPGGVLTPGAYYAEISTPPNPQLHWEKTKTLNFGSDFSMLNNRISGSFEYYIKRGIDLIGPVAVDPTSGVFSFTGNNASIKGNGVDIILNIKGLDDAIFKFYSTFLFSYNTSKVTSYQYSRPITSANLLTIGTPVIGKPLYSIFSYKWAGLDPLNGDPRGYVNDTIAGFAVVQNGNNTKPEDMIYSGPATPTIFGSFRNALRWKNVSMSANITYKMGYFFNRPSINYTNLYANWNGHSDYSLRWKNKGDEKFTNIPSLPLNPNSDRDLFYAGSEVLVEKGDHIRLQDIRLDYELNGSNFIKLPFKSILFYVYANNLGIIWRANKYSIDPDYLTISPPKTIAFGVNIGF